MKNESDSVERRPLIPLLKQRPKLIRCTNGGKVAIDTHLGGLTPRECRISPGRHGRTGQQLAEDRRCFVGASTITLRSRRFNLGPRISASSASKSHRRPAADQTSPYQAAHV